MLGMTRKGEKGGDVSMGWRIKEVCWRDGEGGVEREERKERV